MNKILLHATFIIFLASNSCYAGKTEVFNVKYPLPGKSIAEKQLQYDVTMAVHTISAIKVSIQVPICFILDCKGETDYYVTDAKVIQ